VNEQSRVTDKAARSRALDPIASFIVQAPAGSGKTGLITQRYLVLLARVEHPEEIVAITFTRKAAGEMRRRIIQALAHAQGDRAPQADHEKLTWALAREALARDREKGWQLLDNPGRLRIQTIDSLCTMLAHQMPLLSGFGSVPGIAEDARPLYREAARRTIAELEAQSEWSDAVAHLVLHLDNRLDILQELIATMLARRDQWLRHIADPTHPGLERQSLEASMAHLVSEALAELSASLPTDCGQELMALVRFAAANLEGTSSRIAACADLRSPPGALVAERERWEGIAELLMTEAGAWRKRWTKKEGFPASNSGRDKQQRAQFTEMKGRMAALMESLAGENGFRERLAVLRELPPQRYSDDEWETLQALFELLRLAAAHLSLVFAEGGRVDFPALSQAANMALGEPEAPTDLALALDYRIRHLLVDEFQDTSLNQFRLLVLLTAGWEAGDGRTLFVVGDPMQSIYRFREAEVGLFLDAREGGIGQVPLQFLRLSVNFRSQQGIVDWINRHFPQVLPSADRIGAGAVSYVCSASFHDCLPDAAVTVHPYLQRDDEAEAKQVVSIVRQSMKEHPGVSVAILVRGRSHLAEIVTWLTEAGLRFRAVEIESLAHRPVIQDLLALTRALSHIGDRIAWLAVLRAPYCGLSLADLHGLAGEDPDAPIIELLHRPEHVQRLGEDGRARLARVMPLLDIALSRRASRSLRSNVEGVWIALGGPAFVKGKTDLEDADVYFQLLEELDSAGDVADLNELHVQVERLFALPDVNADESLQLMTIHKAKGLEFDTVIVPGLGRRPRGDDARLLHWLEHTRESGRVDLLLAPISRRGEDKNRIAAYLDRLNKEKGYFEDGRLLYVAATRAKRRLHLLGHTGVRERGGEFELMHPPRDSLLASLWSVVEGDFRFILASCEAQNPDRQEREAPAPYDRALTRLVTDWSTPSPPSSVRIAPAAAQSASGEPVEFSWAGESARHIGTVVHRLLQYIGKVGTERFGCEDLPRFERIARQMLAGFGVSGDLIEEAVERVLRAIDITLQDARGRWVLSAGHANASCELALSSVVDGGLEHIVIDRTFVDEKGTRWIIDYKTGIHSGGAVDEFLDREQERYRDQLERYAAVMLKKEQGPIRLGLYFPLLGKWREWTYAR
jgi:ATP-dependent exoDNAse (exonuclease V) beta subunit